MSIVRVQRKIKDFFVAKNEAMNNKNLSFKAKGLWAYAMSRPDDWKFHVAHLATVSKEKKSAIYSAIKELESEGYCQKEQKHEEGKFTEVDYVIFETKEDGEEFKKCSPHSGFLQPGFLQPENRTLLSTDSHSASSSSSSSEAKEKHKAAPTSSTPSADACFLYVYFMEKIRERFPEFKEPNRTKWEQHFDRMLTIDKRPLQDIKDLILWASEDKWWKKACLSPEKLRAKYDEMMIAKLGDAESILIQANRAYAMEAKRNFPEQLKDLTFDKNYVMHRSAGKEISFNMQREAFIEVFNNTFGGS